MKHVKLVVSDMDGTLLNSNHEVSQRFFNLFKKMQSLNIKFVAASGRPYYSITEKLHPITKDIIIVAENGGLVIENKEVLLSNNIDSNKLNKLYNLVSKIKDVYPIFCTKHCAYFLNTPLEIVNTFSEYYSINKTISSLKEIEDDVIKIALYHSKNSESFIYPHVKHLGSEFNVVVSGNHWVDISESITDKGNALSFLQNRYNIKPSETMVFGDFNNDLEMLKLSKYSYAMANAHKDVKATANFETDTNDNFGVEKIIELLIAESSQD